MNSPWPPQSAHRESLWDRLPREDAGVEGSAIDGLRSALLIYAVTGMVGALAWEIWKAVR